MLASSPSDGLDHIVRVALSRLGENKSCNVEEITTELEDEVGSINDNLVEIVYHFTNRLFPLFHFLNCQKIASGKSLKTY